ncbi:NHLP-related RiPP peptide [Thermomonas mangrovi]|uniref:NHLP-related RiPP peptide n=1 Tax=Thermomonas mangrovi TaxID=2993316 RepID=UPI0023082858|nr:NHLP-related RiPP peptide [Thermomonas mangrovi]
MAQDGPAGLPPGIAKKLLDKLESDEAFRAAFAKAPADALRTLGHTEEAPCIALKPGATLASPAQIKAQRSKIEALMVGIQGYDCALSAQEGY